VFFLIAPVVKDIMPVSVAMLTCEPQNEDAEAGSSSTKSRKMTGIII